MQEQSGEPLFFQGPSLRGIYIYDSNENKEPEGYEHETK